MSALPMAIWIVTYLAMQAPLHAQSHPDGVDDYARAMLLTTQGGDYFQSGDFRKAERTYKLAGDLWERIAPADANRALALLSLAATYHRLEEYSKAEKIVNLAMGLLEKSHA